MHEVWVGFFLKRPPVTSSSSNDSQVSLEGNICCRHARWPGDEMGMDLGFDLGYEMDDPGTTSL